MKFHRKLLLTGFTILFLIALVWDFLLYLSPNKTTTWNFLYNTMYGSILLIGGIMAILYGISFNLKSNLGKMLFFFGLYLLFFAIGNGIYFYYNFVSQVDIPYPSLADIAYVADTFFSVVGIFYLMKIYQPLINKKLILISIVTPLVAIAIIFGYIAKPDLSAELSLAQKFLNLFYPTTDTVNITVASIILLIGGGRLRHGLSILALGLLLVGIGDLIYTHDSTIGTYWVGSIADFFYTCSGYFVTIGLIEITNSMQKATVTTERPNDTLQTAATS